ncbi:MAG: cupin domain-containing protein [Smithella sp.]|nr:cupin domain-containing protein [Smithella sp.]HOU51402.1 cupin domain-containing protein [Smithella sp.]HQG66346.1 cupin domain-containing protein [Smithella sp.]HQH16926.1 cupin domain-containing protein [Smithella sp.]HQI73132.1 cupin domain-containing protein [Smithella sp.]
MKAKIKKQNLKAEFYMAEGCFITELSNSADDPAVSIARARVEPGVTTRRHRLQGITERYFIISGKGRVEIGDLPPQEVNSGDVVLIPPMCSQRIANIGKEDLIFLAICSPRYTQDVYEDVEDING